MSKVDESTTLYYTVCLPKIWNQNITVSQILIMFLLNFVSVYFQSTLLLLLPNVILLIIYILINNIQIHKGYSQDFVKALEAHIDFTHCVNKLNTKVIKDHSYPSFHFPYTLDPNLLFQDKPKNSLVSQIESFEKENFSLVGVKCDTVSTMTSTTATMSCIKSIPSQYTIPQ